METCDQCYGVQLCSCYPTKVEMEDQLTKREQVALKILGEFTAGTTIAAGIAGVMAGLLAEGDEKRGNLGKELVGESLSGDSRSIIQHSLGLADVFLEESEKEE